MIREKNPSNPYPFYPYPKPVYPHPFYPFTRPTLPVYPLPVYLLPVLFEIRNSNFFAAGSDKPGPDRSNQTRPDPPGSNPGFLFFIFLFRISFTPPIFSLNTPPLTLFLSTFYLKLSFSQFSLFSISQFIV